LLEISFGQIGVNAELIFDTWEKRPEELSTGTFGCRGRTRSEFTRIVRWLIQEWVKLRATYVFPSVGI